MAKIHMVAPNINKKYLFMYPYPVQKTIHLQLGKIGIYVNDAQVNPMVRPWLNKVGGIFKRRFHDFQITRFHGINGQISGNVVV